MAEFARRKPPRRHADEVVTVLAVGLDEADRKDLRRIFDSSNWVMYEVENCEEALGFLKSNPLGVIVCEYRMDRACWHNLLQEISPLEKPPLMVVTSRRADDSLWAEVLNMGGYDVLAQPYDKSEVVRVLSLAWLHWKTGLTQPGVMAAYAS